MENQEIIIEAKPFISLSDEEIRIKCAEMAVCISEKSPNTGKQSKDFIGTCDSIYNWVKNKQV